MNTSDDTDRIKSLPWTEILELSKSDRFDGRFNSIPEETLLFAMRESNRPQLIQSAVKSLESTDPENATIEYATKVADMMREFALRVLAERKKN
ncbi:MAG: hypothetical protein ABI758_05765 [Candidatus Woesebacteria bacterium]